VTGDNWKRTFSWHLARIEHHIALEAESIYLMDENSADLPWDKVEHVEAGGTHRLGVPVSLSFRTRPIGKGGHALPFRWHFDLEKRDANGTSAFKFDLERIGIMFAKLPPMIALRVRDEILPQFAEAAEKMAGGEMRVAQDLYAAAAMFRGFGRERDEQEATA
jgi:hypothetical protein